MPEHHGSRCTPGRPMAAKKARYGYQCATQGSIFFGVNSGKCFKRRRIYAKRVPSRSFKRLYEICVIPFHGQLGRCLGATRHSQCLA